MSNEEIVNAIKIAKNTKDNAFVLHFNPKGACIVTTDGKMFGGCNIESDISGLGLCAERAAIDHAVVNGQYEYKGIVVFDENLSFPCGVCLQYLNTFSQINNFDIEIICASDESSFKKYNLSQMLPLHYGSDSNISKLKEYKNKDLKEVRKV